MGDPVKKNEDPFTLDSPGKLPSMGTVKPASTLAYVKGLKEESNDPLLKMLDNPKDLPSLPNILSEIQKIINDPRSSGSDLKTVIEKDQSMTAAILKLINSAYYAIPGGVSNLQRAIAYLGYDAVYQVAIAVSVLKSFKVVNFQHFKLSDFWLHSFSTAAYAEEIAKTIKFQKTSDAFTSGLLHDLGKVFVAKHDPERLTVVIEKCFSQNMTYYDVEREVFPISHTAVGERLANHWRLPRGIGFTMKYHHELELDKRSSLVPEEHQLVDIVIVANALTHRSKRGNSGYPSAGEPPDLVLKRLNLSHSQFHSIETQVEQKMKAAQAFLSLL